MNNVFPNGIHRGCALRFALALHRTIFCARVSNHEQKDDLAPATGAGTVLRQSGVAMRDDRSRKNQKLIDGVRQVVRDVQC